MRASAALAAREIDWISTAVPVAYPEALAWMDARATTVAEGAARECVWLLEHPALYTAGTSADSAELLDSSLPVFRAGRGGRYTYHGPGQLVGYIVLDLGQRGRDVRCFVHALEGWLIRSLARLGVEGRREPGRVGIWTGDEGGSEAKVAAIGVRIRRWVSLHGFSINLDPELAHFDGIVPCGIADRGVTSIARLGGVSDRAAAEGALRAEFDTFLDDMPLKQST